MPIGGTEAANLFVRVTGDISDASRKLGDIGGLAQKTGGIMSGALSTALGFGAATVGLNAVGGAMGLLQQGAIGMNAQLEKSTLQFTTLMGSSTKAEAKVKDLFDFAAKTPFESGPIIEASRIMQTFGGDALNTMDNLKLFGDAAAATSAPINEVSFWMSRAYAAIQGGQPFGEARMRLMELGIITPKVAGEMEAMQKEGASSTQLWGKMTGELGKFNGAMDKQAGTWEGLTSTMMDSINMALANGFKPLFEGLKKVVGGFNELMASPAFQGALQAASAGLVAVFGLLGDAFKTVVDFVSPIVSAFSGVAGAADMTGSSIGNLATTILTALMNAGSTLYGALLDWQMKIGTWVLDALPGLIVNLQTFAQTMFDWLMNTGIPAFGAQMGVFADKAISWITDTVIPKLGVVLPQFLNAILDFVTTNGPVLATKLIEWARTFVNWLMPRLPEMLGKLADFAGKMVVWLITQGVPKLLAAAVALGSALIKGIWDSVTGSGGQGKGILASLVEWITGTMIPGILGLGGKLLAAGANIAGSLGRGFANALVGFVEGGINSIIRGINSIRFNIHLDLPTGPVDFGFAGLNLPYVRLPRFARGTDFVPATGPAILHRGEMVLPAALAQSIREGLLSGRGGGAQTIVININDFHGTEDNIRQLAQALGEVTRYGTLRRSHG